MVLPVPSYVSSTHRPLARAEYAWDEWHVNDYFLAVDESSFNRLDLLSDAANLALAIGCGEWICHLLSDLSDDTDPWHYLEAAWAAVVHPYYCEYVETDDDQWRGPVRGPLNLTISILNDGIHCRDTDPHEATRACWMRNLTEHVLPDTGAFLKWIEASILRLEAFHKKSEDRDIWEEGPPLGDPVPREALNPAVDYDAAAAPAYLDNFLRALDWRHNPFLRRPEDVRAAPAFQGTPYTYTEE